MENSKLKNWLDNNRMHSVDTVTDTYLIKIGFTQEEIAKEVKAGNLVENDHPMLSGFYNYK